EVRAVQHEQLTHSLLEARIEGACALGLQRRVICERKFETRRRTQPQSERGMHPRSAGHIRRAHFRIGARHIAGWEDWPRETVARYRWCAEKFAAQSHAQKQPA